MMNATVLSITTEDAWLLVRVLESWMGIPRNFDDEDTKRVTEIFAVLLDMAHRGSRKTHKRGRL